MLLLLLLLLALEFLQQLLRGFGSLLVRVLLILLILQVALVRGLVLGRVGLIGTVIVHGLRLVGGRS